MECKVTANALKQVYTPSETIKAFVFDRVTGQAAGWEERLKIKEKNAIRRRF